MEKQEIATFYPKSRQEWRKWLQKHHATETSVWVLFYKKSSEMPSMSWSDAVDEALCFGWVDSKRKPIDADKFIQFFSRRKPNSTWSKINKAKILQLTKDGLMTDAGEACIKVAKKNGSWNILNTVDTLKIPGDLKEEFAKHDGSLKFFKSLSKSAQKVILAWLIFAKRPETRQKRINEIAELAGQGLKPKQFR